MKRFYLIITALLFSFTTFAQELSETDFTQVKLMKVSGKTIDKVGHITFDGNDHLTMTYTVPEGEYFVLGDRWDLSVDSRSAAFAPRTPHAAKYPADAQICT